MRELSLHILDIACNSVSAEAKNISIDIDICADADLVTITVADDGKGMDAQTLALAHDPFTTTRTTRKVGMGLPLLGLAAKMSGGGMEIVSDKGVGTTVKATFKITSVNRVPMGDLAETLLTLTLSAEHYALHFSIGAGDRTFKYSTEEIRREVGYGNFQAPEVLEFLKSYLQENILDICGGII